MLKLTKWLIWLYMLLLMFEGALRKWVFPGAADALLVVRDPVLLGIYAFAVLSGRVPRSAFLGAVGALTLASVIFSFLAGQTNIIVLAYGLRTNYLHLPLIWVIAEVFDREDVDKMGSWLLLIGMAMTALMVQQFRSPADAIINCGVGGDPDAQIHGAGGHIRPPGFFSFIIGPTVFFPVYTAFFLHQASSKRRLWWPLLVGAGLALAIALPISISRGTAIAAGVVGIALVLGMIRLGVFNMAIIRMALVGVAVVFALSFTPVFKDARYAFMDRWTIAAEESGGRGWGSLVGRVTSVVEVPVALMSQAPVFGYGVGYGSSVAARILTGQRGFLLAEDEWSKCYLELGPLLGSAFLLFRIVVAFYLLAVAWQALKRDRDTLPLMLWAACGPTTIIFFQWAQPTVLGFAVLTGGLLLAATKHPEEQEEEENEEDSDDEEDESEEPDTDDEAEAEAPSELEVQRRRMRGL
ncbi:hypothetical protein DB347_13710 [Opitutaceae bacterium EW11]|nr:hypothetical protein DB347_13710 [Opitutaceae bacterium EW11]